MQASLARDRASASSSASPLRNPQQFIAEVFHLCTEAPGCDPRKETIGASHEGVIGLKEVHEGGSFWSVSGQTREPVCTLHVDRKEGQNILKQYLSHLKDPQAGILEFDNEQQQEKRESEIGQARTECVCVDEQQVLKQSFEDELICNLASPFCPLAASSAACSHQRLEREFNELNLQETKLDAFLFSSEEGNVLTHASPPASLEGSSGFVGSASLSQGSGEVATLSIESNESNVGLTKLKSSLRGGYEKAGLGSRPKVHITWAPNVYDPPCTSTSHTITRNQRRHYHPRSEHKNRHKGKGSSHSDSHKKSQKKIRKSKHSSENFVSDPTLVSQRGILNNRLMLEDPTWKSAKVSPFILPPKGCFLNPVLPFCERDQVTLEKIRGCSPWHVQAHELCR